MEKNKLEKRMYVLVNRSLGQINKGIQALHAVVEYGLKYPTTEYFEWANEYKTVIVLDGGTSNSETSVMGDMENQFVYLFNELNMNAVTFHEPDVNNCLTAIAFIVDERVFDREKYVSLNPMLFEFCEKDVRYVKYMNKLLGSEKNVKLREFLSQFRLAL